MTQTASVTVTRRGAERAAPDTSDYRSDIRRTRPPPAARWCAVRDERGRGVGQALYSDRSEIALRLLTAPDETIDREWWRRRLRDAVARRAGVEASADPSGYLIRRATPALAHR